MNLFSIRSLLGFDTHAALERSEMDKVISSLSSMVSQEELITPVLQKYHSSHNLDFESQLTNYIQTYFSLEQFILSNQPPVVVQAYTKDELREAVRKVVTLDSLPVAFRLIFLSDKEQLFSLFVFYTGSLSSYLFNQVGLSRLQEIINSLHTISLFPQVTGEGIDWGSIKQNLLELSADDLISYFKNLNSGLFAAVSSSFGLNAAIDITQKVYSLVKSRYDYHLISDALKVLPDAVLDKERMAYLTLDELEEEKARRESAEKSAKELQETVEELKKSKETVLDLLTESHNLEKDLRAERDRVKAIISSMNEGLFVVSKDYRIILINESAVKLLSVAEEMALGQNIMDFFPLTQHGRPLSHEEYPASVTINTGKKILADIADDLFYAPTNGKKFPVMISVSPLFEQNRSAISGAALIFRDITDTLQYEQTLRDEKKIIEEKVKEQTKELTTEQEALKQAIEKVNSNYLQAQKSEAKLLASITSLPLGFILTDSEDAIVSINPSAKQIFSLSEDVATITAFTEKLGKKFDFSATITQCKAIKTSVDIKEFEWEKKILHLIFTPIFFEQANQEYIGTVLLIDDITEEKLLERTKDEFFAIASHDLRTPLTAIRVYSSLIKTYYQDKVSKEILDMINNIDESSVHLIEIVNEYLNVSRLEQGKIVFNVESFAVTDLINEVIHEVGNLAEKKQLYLRLEPVEGSVHQVTGDRERTKQVVMNLVGNAIKFTDQGGISIHVEEKQQMVFVRVTDTGRGIVEKNQQLLFKKFQQTIDLTRDPNHGSGLGLYITKRILENMDGTIELEHSEEGKGSTFVFALPIAKP